MPGRASNECYTLKSCSAIIFKSYLNNKSKLAWIDPPKEFSIGTTAKSTFYKTTALKVSSKD